MNQAALPRVRIVLGGFSAPAVHSIVSRIVDALGTLVGGDPRDQAAVEVQEAVTRVRTTLDQDRRRIAAKAFSIGEDAASALRIGDDARREEASESLRAEIREIMIELLPEIDDEPPRGTRNNSNLPRRRGRS